MNNTEFFTSSFRISEHDIAYMETQIGKKTINQMRAEHGLQMVVGGDQPYTDWLRELMGYKVQMVH